METITTLWLKQNTEKNLIVILGFVLFFVNTTVRAIFSETSFNIYFNVIFLAVSVFLLVTLFCLKRLSVSVFFAALALLFIGIVINLLNAVNLFQHLVFYINMILPLTMTGLLFQKNVAVSAFSTFLKIFNFVMMITICFGVIDMLTDGQIQHFMIQHIFPKRLAEIVLTNYHNDAYRFYFIFGHSLTITWYVLLFFSLNIIHARYLEPIMPSLVVTLITLMGLIVCNSRTGLVIGLVMILLFSKPQKYQLLYYTIMIVVVATILALPLVQDNITSRFSNAVESNSFSGGRNEALNMVLNGYIDSPKLLDGLGPSGSLAVTKELGGFIKSFEYPLIMFMYDYSIIGTALLYYIITLRPIGKLIKKRLYLIAGLFISMMLFLNGFNIMVTYTDYFAQICFVVMLLVNLNFTERDWLTN